MVSVCLCQQSTSCESSHRRTPCVRRCPRRRSVSVLSVRKLFCLSSVFARDVFFLLCKKKTCIGTKIVRVPKIICTCPSSTSFPSILSIVFVLLSGNASDMYEIVGCQTGTLGYLRLQIVIFAALVICVFPLTARYSILVRTKSPPVSPCSDPMFPCS